MDTFRIENISIYFFRFSSYKNRESQFLKYLIDDEITRSERYHFAKDTNQYIICRGILRTLLSEKTGIDAKKLQLEYNAFGKPFLSQTQNAQNIHFNISHSHDCGLIAISPNREVGIDIEKIKELSDMNSLAEYTFSRREVKFYKRSENKLQCFYHIWTQKEAIVKASGEGLSLGLKEWSIDPYKDKYSLIVKKNSFTVQKLELTEGYAAAIALREIN